MSYLIRFSVDLLLPEGVNPNQLNTMVQKILDHAGPVVAYQEMGVVVTESKPSTAGRGWHVHDGTDRCGDCRSLSTDGKNAVSVEATK